MNSQHRSAELWATGAPTQTDAGIDDSLAKRDTASEFFAGSIKLGDIFRMIASHLREVIPAKGVELYLQDETQRWLRIAEMDGCETGLADDTLNADTCFAKRAVHVADGHVVAIPLLNELSPFGVIQLYFQPGVLSPEISDKAIFEAIGTRVAPLILNSLAYERSLSHALTDAITDLPNERALFLALEEQIGGSQRKGGERSLIVLAFDIKDFQKINKQFGHAAADRVLDHAAGILKDDLRHMEFVARCRGDEFLAVLQTASRDTAAVAIDRVNTAFFGRRFEISGEQSIEIALNFGWATFGCDGETAEQLIAAARVRKAQAKAVLPSKVLWFSKELAR